MHKLFTAIFLAAIISSPLYAASSHATRNPYPWEITTPETYVKYYNDMDDELLFHVAVESHVGISTDKVIMTCNGEEQYLPPKGLVMCLVKGYGEVSLRIAAKDFKNGASGRYEWSLP